MASNRVCKVVTCANGEQQIVCAAAWLWRGGTNWACTFGQHVMRKGGNGGTFYHAASKSYVTIHPVNSPKGLRLSEAGTDEGEMPTETFLEKYWMLLLAAALIGYCYFYKK